MAGGHTREWQGGPFTERGGASAGRGHKPPPRHFPTHAGARGIAIADPPRQEMQWTAREGALRTGKKASPSRDLHAAGSGFRMKISHAWQGCMRGM